ncbi:retrotransposon protein, putative, ty1-copia subclass [Tanacetum coccineum]
MTRKSFPHRPERATDLLGIIHTDVCGLLRHVSRQDASYFITFSDDYSRYGYVYLLKHKHEVFETFKVFKNEVENQLGKTIKALRSDRGGEYISQEFKDYLKACGIVQQLTPPYTPQHNGVSERRNRTLLDMVRSMMNLTTLPLSFWDYALESATRILNMVPTKKVDKTPYELWYGKVPNLSYLKVWGCEALVKRDTPDKLQQRSVKCIFIGYPKETMGYYFYFPPENKIVVARYAEFFEKNLITQEVSGRAMDLEEIQDEDTSPSEITSEIPMEVEGFEPPQEEVIPWIDAMNAEIQSMMDNRVWVLVDLPPGCKTVGSKWIFKKKTDMDSIIHTYKARLVAKCYTQLYGVDYEETFSPVADIRAIRILISIAAFYDYEIWQMYVKSAFLNGYLDEDIYMVQPEGFVDPNHPRKVCKLQRSIYGLKQASRSCNKRFDEEIKKFGFDQNLDEPCVYQKASGNNVTFLIFTTGKAAYITDYIAASEAEMEAVWIRNFISGLGYLSKTKFTLHAKGALGLSLARDFKTIQQRKEDLFDEYRTLSCYWKRNQIHDYFERFPQACNDMRLLRLNIPTSSDETPSLSTTFQAYWGTVSTHTTTSSGRSSNSRTTCYGSMVHIVTEPFRGGSRVLVGNTGARGKNVIVPTAEERTCCKSSDRTQEKDVTLKLKHSLAEWNALALKINLRRYTRKNIRLLIAKTEENNDNTIPDHPVLLETRPKPQNVPTEVSADTSDKLQGKDATIRNLDAQINIMKVLNVGSTVGSFDKQALETEITQLKDALTSVRIQIDGYKAENVNLKRLMTELSDILSYSHSTFTTKINA